MNYLLIKIAGRKINRSEHMLLKYGIFINIIAGRKWVHEYGV